MLQNSRNCTINSPEMIKNNSNKLIVDYTHNLCAFVDKKNAKHKKLFKYLIAMNTNSTLQTKKKTVQNQNVYTKRKENQKQCVFKQNKIKQNINQSIVVMINQKNPSIYHAKNQEKTFI
eukprot:TRINITY_DN2354_c0_g1_i6.p1 TRINITY_DN2354_c0_g1~~TRINITY_DN2354_c0_g1_i6.p1  ORF type:complete len:119 (-),score=0.37 TRINITY_DN2354_c0_g1_i6:701-1057(-)